MIRQLLTAIVGGTHDYLTAQQAEIDRLRALVAELTADRHTAAESTAGLSMPAGRRWAGQALRRGSEAGDLAVAWTDTTIITIVPTDEAEAHALVSYAMRQVADG
jgi:hypothetical protein